MAKHGKKKLTHLATSSFARMQANRSGSVKRCTSD